MSVNSNSGDGIMIEISAEMIGNLAYRLIKRASIELPPDVERRLQEAYEQEHNPNGKAFFESILKNLAIAKENRTPICQDTGVPIYYIDIGSEIIIKGSIREAIDEATRRATAETPLRPQVTHPLTFENPGNNTGWGIPPIYYDRIEGGNYVDILAVPRGGGAESKWQCVALYHAAPREKAIMKVVLDTVSMAGGECCPPTIIGVGLGGFGREYSELLARKAIFRSPLNSRHPDPLVAELEDKLVMAVNQMEIGPLGIGGSTSCLGLHIELAGGHTASCSVAVALSCWAARYSRARIYGNGTVDFITHPNLKEQLP
jgi:tartrate/fumarate subfamily iron-sulfur-dependent hydro-lyase alpha chain